MRLYSMKKKHYLFLAFLFLSIVGVSVLVGVVGPSVLESFTVYGSNSLDSKGKLSSGPFIIQSKPVLLYQKELWLSAVFHREPASGVASLVGNISVSVICQSLSSHDKASASTQEYTKRIHAICSTEVCDELPIIHLGVLDCDAYTFTIDMVGFDEKLDVDVDEPEVPLHPETSPTGSASFAIADVEFMLQTFNPYFSYFELFSRFIALLATFGLMITFTILMRRFETKSWTIEQRWTVTLLLLLLLFYNPFHPMVFLLKSWVPQICDYVFQMTFLSAMLLFWLCVFHGLRVTQRSTCCFCLPKFALTTCIWMVLVGYALWKVKMEVTDPMFDLSSSKIPLMAFAGSLGCLGFVYLLYLFILMCRTCSEMYSQAYFHERLRFVTFPMLFVMISFGVMLGLRIDVQHTTSFRPVSTKRLPGEDLGVSNFAQHTSSTVPAPLYRSAFELSFSFGVCLAYMCLLVIAYSPAKNALTEANYKDNPTVSMINDSDEDVLFGSDHEDLQLHMIRRR